MRRNIHIEITRIKETDRKSGMFLYQYIYGKIDNEKEILLGNYFARQDETYITKQIGAVGLRYYTICETCFEHKGVIVHGPMMHGIQGYFCECCLAGQRLEYAILESLKVPKLQEEFLKKKEICK